MKFTILLLSLALLLGSSNGFTTGRSLSIKRASKVAKYGYVPSGFTPEEYKKLKAAEAEKKANLNLGGLGPRGFKSRSFQSFQEALDRGEASHLMPVFQWKEKVKTGELKRESIPYMQRGGSWDNSDVKGGKKVRWLNSDKDYASGGFTKRQSVSIFGYGKGLDWTGSKGRSGPESVSGAAPKFGKNYKAPNIRDVQKGAVEQPKKKFFGII